MLINLRYETGFEGRFNKLQTDDLESVFHEMMIAKLVKMSNIPFCFIDEGGTTGMDYDLEMTLGNTRVACETKCKMESTETSESTIWATLEKGRKQLPKDKPGILFVSVPEAWLSHPDAETHMASAINKLFRQSRRVSTIILSWEIWEQVTPGEFVGRRHFATHHHPSPYFSLEDYGVILSLDRPTAWRELVDIVSPYINPQH